MGAVTRGLAACIIAAGCGGNDGTRTTAASAGGGLGGFGTDGGDGSTGGVSPDGDDTGDKLDVAGTAGAEGNAGDGHEDPCQEVAEAASNQGCEFWAVDLPNVWASTHGNPPPEDQQFAVVVANTAGDVEAQVHIFAGASDQPVDAATVSVGGVHEFRLPAASVPSQGNSVGMAYRIEADVPITAYQFQPLDNTTPVFSNDASLLFPSHVLGEAYTAVTGDSLMLTTDAGTSNAGAFVSVVATEDGTTVDLYATASLYPGSTQVTLDRGEVATFLSSGSVPGQVGDGNLSGSRVTADAPVAVFSGNVAALEPQPGQCCADHLEHQMLPMVAWGTAYLAAPAAAPSGAGTGDRSAFRITGVYDGTLLEYSPAAPAGAPMTIDAGQTLRFESSTPFSVRSLDPDKPISLTQFLLSNVFLAGPAGQPGDPAMIALPAAAQFRDRYVFLVPAGYEANYVTVYRPQGEPILLDEQVVGGVTWHPGPLLEGAGWEYAHVPVGVGSHVIRTETEDVGFGIVSVGYSEDVSYGYPGGSGVSVIAEPPPPPAG
ncbi:MAG: IgGFc-binding protein [Myxococcota bacterium]